MYDGMSGAVSILGMGSGSGHEQAVLCTQLTERAINVLHAEVQGWPCMLPHLARAGEERTVDTSTP